MLTSGPLDTYQPLDAFDEIRKKVAIKCDLCAGYKDQACVEACPVGAAVRIQPTKFFGSTEEILTSEGNISVISATNVTKFKGRSWHW